MSGMFSSQDTRRFIDNGRVPCPQRGRDVEFDVCAACCWLCEIEEKGGLPFVRCGGEAARGGPDPLLLLWPRG